MDPDFHGFSTGKTTFFPFQCGPPRQFTWFITPISMIYGTTIVNGAYKTIYNWGGPHCFSCLFLQATIFYCKASSLRGETSISLDFGDPTTPGAVKNTGGIHHKNIHSWTFWMIFLQKRTVFFNQLHHTASYLAKAAAVS